MANHQSTTFSLSVSLVFFLAVTSAALLFSSAEAGRHRRRPNAQVIAICKHTDYPSVCMAYAKLPRKNRPLHAPGLTKSSIMATIVATKEANGLASKLMSSTSNRMRKANLSVCRNVYLDALDNLHTSVKNLKARSITDLKINLSAALSDYTVCEDGFAQTPGDVSPLAKMNSLLHQLTSNSLALADMRR